MRIVIVGAGISGLAAAKELQNHGHHDYVILEKSGGVGGVWRENHYPGAACDVPSYLYSFSWAKRRDWSQPCSPQSEIEQYLTGVARDHGILEHCRFGAEVTTTVWDEASRTWTVALASGEHLACDLLIMGCGQLSRPAWPNVDGRDTFAGDSFHSAEWNHDVDLTGKRVVVVGTGASAVQFVPPVAEQAAHLTVFQRTAPYMLPRRNPRYPRAVKAAFQYIPGVQQMRRAFMRGVLETFVYALTGARPVYHALRLWSTSFMRAQIKDPVLREKLAPDYEFGCKRILFSSYYLPALQRPNVDVITEAVAAVTPAGVTTTSGQQVDADVIIYGTGFRAGEFVTPIAVHGRGGRELQDTWSQAPVAHRGVAVHGYPNLFLMYGPNTNLGVGSIIVMIEAQAAYVAQVADLLQATPGTAVEVTAAAQEESDAAVQEAFDGTVWTECVSWYRQGGTGRIVGNWPRYMGTYARLLKDFDHEHYTVDIPAPVPAVAA